MQQIELSFEEAQPQDAPALADFMAQVMAETDFISWDETVALTSEQLAEVLAQRAASANQLCLLAKAGETILGLISVQASAAYSFSHIGDVFLAVRQPYWGQGIGGILLDEVITWAQAGGLLRRLSLTVQVRNTRAVALYRKFGFEIEGTQARGVRTNEGEFLDVYAMAKLIDG